MRTETIEFHKIRYNPADEAFEARVSILDNGIVLEYAVSVKAPVTAEYTLIVRRLTEVAKSAHQHTLGAMRLRRAAPQTTALAA